MVADVRARQAKVILQEPFYNIKAAEFVVAKTGARSVVAPTMTGGSPEASSYLGMLDNVIGKLSAAL